MSVGMLDSTTLDARYRDLLSESEPSTQTFFRSLHSAAHLRTIPDCKPDCFLLAAHFRWRVVTIAKDFPIMIASHAQRHR